MFCAKLALLSANNPNRPVRKMKKSLRQSKRMNSRSKMIPRNLSVVWVRMYLSVSRMRATYLKRNSRNSKYMCNELFRRRKNLNAIIP